METCSPWRHPFWMLARSSAQSPVSTIQNYFQRISTIVISYFVQPSIPVPFLSDIIYNRGFINPESEVILIPRDYRSSQLKISVECEIVTKVLKLREYFYWYVGTHLDVNNSTIRANTIKLSNETTEETEKQLPNRELFYFYTKNNLEEPQQLFIDDVVTLNNSNVDMQRQTKFVTHGWRIDRTYFFENYEFTPSHIGYDSPWFSMG